MNCHKHCRDLVGMECVKKHKNNSSSCPCTPAPDSRAKGTLWSSEEEAFVFPHGNDGENNKGAAFRKTADSALYDCSTQTEPGVWTPEKKERRIYNHGAPGQANTLPSHRSRGCSMPVSFLQEKLEEMHLCKEKSREPD